MDKQNLENIDPLDAFIQENLNKMSAKAPDGLWDSIAQDLESSNTDQLLDQKLQEAFPLNHKAPSSLFNSIFEDLDATPNFEESLDKKINAAYQSKNHAPESIWQQIDQQLNIDTIWRNMAPPLDGLRRQYKIRRFLRQMAVAAVLLLFIRGCGLNWIPGSSEGSNTEFQAIVLDNPNNSSILKIEVPSTKEPNLNGSNNQSSTPKISIQRSKTAFSAPIVRVVLPNQSSSFLIDSIKNNSISELQLNQDNFILNNAHKTTINAALLSNTSIATANVEMLQTALVGSSELEILETAQIPSKTKKRLSHEIGAVAGFQNAVIANDINAKALIANQGTVDSKVPMSFAFGLSHQMRFAKRQAISTEIWLNKRSRQIYEFYSQRKLVRQEIRLDYSQINSAYTFEPLVFSTNGVENRLFVKTGAYLAYLRQHHLYSSVNSKYQSSRTQYKDWDFGVNLLVGNKHCFHSKIVLEYGVRSSLGLVDVLSNPQIRQSAQSNLLHFGVYASLRYKL